TSLYTLIVGSVVAVLIPVFLGLGPIAWVAGAVAAMYGAEKILRESELPQKVREPMLSDTRIFTVRAELLVKLSTELQSKFGSDFVELQAAIGKQIRAQVQEQVEKELRLIR